MEEISQNIKDFEYLLKNRMTNRPSALYSSSEHKNESQNSMKTNEISAKDVLTDVAKQVSAFQNADTVSKKRVNKALDSYKKKEFLPVATYRIRVPNKVPSKLPTKFETQCVTDTQLIDVVENAEIIDNHRGVTQEFDKTFCQKSDNDSDDRSDHDTSISNTDTDKNKRIDDKVAADKNDCLNNHDSILFEKTVFNTCEMDIITCAQNDVTTNLNLENFVNTENHSVKECIEISGQPKEDTDRSASPILNTFRRNATPPLVVDLYTFEKFQDIALPIIEEHEDLKLARNMINSQIIGREIFIPDHFNENAGSTSSPVLNKIECITTNINKDDEEKICTCSNKCVERNVQSSNELKNEEFIVDSGNAKKETSIKMDIKDEILFSSDEEYEYLHKDVQELPLTCALETSFYDRSDVLDKTMYVGFQTASNKSIQINTDSFTKAKSLLSNIDDKETGKSLSDLVEIFDSGNAIGGKEESLILNSNKPECDTNNINFDKEDKDVPVPSTNSNDLTEPTNDIFKNVDLTALEQNEEFKEDVVMSQIIQFKSLTRAKLNSSIMSESKMGDDTLNNVILTGLEPDKPDDDDVIMSQVIPFKSVTRTQNIDNVHCSSVTQESILSKGIPKRKLEGFKTASNKKIKLSDKAIARCKKVFQGIDLEDSEDISCDKNIVEDYFDDFKSHDFSVSKDDLMTNSEIDPSRNTNICDNVSDKVIQRDSETDGGCKKEQSIIDNVDLQINDQIILQEFECNEMPFSNNNSYVGFKTASNKNIAISDDAVAATKHLFKDLMTIKTTSDCDNIIKTPKNISGDSDAIEHVFKKPVANSRNASKQTKSSKDSSTKPYNNKIQERNDDDVRFSHKQAKNEFSGFKTASQKEIVISEHAIEKTKDFYKDLDNDKNVDNKDTFHLNTKNKHINYIEDDFNCGIDTQDFLAEELTRIADLCTETTKSDQKPSCPSFEGFQTASMKPVIVSKKALEKSKKLFEDITNKDVDMECNLIEKKVNKTVSDNFLLNSKKHSRNVNIIKNVSNNMKVAESFKETEESRANQYFNDLVIASNSAEKFSSPLGNSDLAKQGSSPTKDKPILSERTFENIKEIKTKSDLEDSKNSDLKEMHTESPRFLGFKTASDKPIIISVEAKEKSKKLLSEFELQDEEMMEMNHMQTLKSKPSTFVGFQTASRKKIEISAEALTNSKRIFDSYNADQTEYITDNSVNHTEPKKDLHEDNFKDLNKFVGFQTARNKEIRVSEEAFLATSKQMFQDVDINEINTDELNKKTNRHEENESPVFKGFQTASNKKVTISEKALKKSKKLFHDLGNDDSNKANEDVPVFKGFLTASNKKVDISEKALEKCKQVFEDIKLSQRIECKDNNLRPVKVSEEVLPLAKEQIDSYICSPPVFKGFQTASMKKVEISEKALAKTKKLFEDLNLSQLDKDPKIMVAMNCDDFPPINNKGIKVPEQDSVKTKDNSENRAPVFKGFQTASNKKVEISEKALAKCKKLFEDINLSQLDKDNFGKNPTSNSKRVNISERDSVKTKDNYRDIYLEKDTNSLEENTAPVFKGFQTASNKKVDISEAALAKSKRLFDDMNLSQIKDPKTSVDLHEENASSFQTANNKKVKILEQELEDTEHNIFRDNDILKETENHRHCKEKEIKTTEVRANLTIDITNTSYISPIKLKGDINVNANDIIDTQVINVFQETLNTEDFCKSTPTSKRSGSPILSCPRAKKRKFQTPYSASKKVELIKTFVPPKLAKTYKFEDNYKKNKIFTLKDVAKLEDGNTKTIDPYIAEFNFETLLNFVFFDKRNDFNNEKFSIEDLKKIFLGSVNKNIVPDGWLDNHIKLIIWKLLSYEIKFPNVMKNICTVRNVLEQLKYRYDRELYHVQRPILRKILEKDEVPSKSMVLCVAAIYVDNVSVTSVPPTSQNVEFCLTDGWYCVKASLDRMLVRMLVSGAIVVGTKLAVCGAELVNCEQGVAPWEDTSSVRLKVHGNSARRACWLARLGARTDVISRPLAAARPDGGKMAAARVLVTRVYPTLYVEKMDDGSTVTLSERLENIRQMKYESERQVIMEKLYEELEKEMSDQDSQDSEGYTNEKGLESGSQISRGMKQSKDPDEFRSHLTKSQNRLLEDHNARQREKLIERVRQKFQQKLDKNGLKTERNVVPLLKVRVAGLVEKGGKVDITKGYLSIWKPSAAVLELVTEGSWVQILNVIPTGIRNSEIQLSAGRQTVFNPYKQTNDKLKLYTNNLQRKCYEIKEITQNPAMTTDNNEIDTVGMIFCIEPSTKDFKEQNFQNVYLADADKNIICVNFWGGLKKFGFENVLDTGQVVTCLNLQKRAGNTRKSIPQYRVTEFSYFTKTPKSKKALEITNELTNKLSKIKEKFCEDCIILKNNYSIFKTRDFENVSPYRFESHASKNVASPSPLRNSDTNLNLTGLDFESSFNSQEISPQILLRKKKVNEKIEKIRLNYGEPPPLSSIHIINKSKNASATYKSPLISNERSKMESPLKNVASPVTVNRTFVKSVNPVRLNFSENLEDSADQFSEDFDASPPLSLDSNVLD